MPTTYEQLRGKRVYANPGWTGFCINCRNHLVTEGGEVVDLMPGTRFNGKFATDTGELVFFQPCPRCRNTVEFGTGIRRGRP
ncbi:hypothetical protein [Nonomuraea sp. NPDC023979]|uniref:hypothetical protein n=1 Tax=Nonomuraea sp. NPDC023979 TaxID=3154796 RepID=UPI0033ECEB10